MMNINGAAFGNRIRAAGGQSRQAGDSYDAKIQKLQEKRAEYIEKLKNVRNEATSGEHARQLTAMYQESISAIDMQITQLQKMKAESARRKVEERQTKTGEAGKSGDAEKAEERGKAEKEGGIRASSDPFDEKRSGIRNEETPEERRKREEKYLGLLIDVVA